MGDDGQSMIIAESTTHALLGGIIGIASGAV